jgi:hypothetical protein
LAKAQERARYVVQLLQTQQDPNVVDGGCSSGWAAEKYCSDPNVHRLTCRHA